MKLENWSLRVTNSGIVLFGNVYDHPEYEDGQLIGTSRIMNTTKPFVYTYSGSVYELGKVSVEYEKLFPDARKRLFDQKNKALH